MLKMAWSPSSCPTSPFSATSLKKSLPRPRYHTPSLPRLLKSLPRLPAPPPCPDLHRPRYHTPRHPLCHPLRRSLSWRLRAAARTAKEEAVKCTRRLVRLSALPSFHWSASLPWPLCPGLSALVGLPTALVGLPARLRRLAARFPAIPFPSIPPSIPL
jgi:hypothetical protein